MKLFNSEKNASTFYCFTPPVSFATFLIEFIFAFYVLYKYKPTLFSYLCVLTLMCLGLFQLSEFLICTTPYFDFAIKMGFISITLLPALGLHIATILTGKGKRITALSYLAASGFIIALLFVPEIAFLASCQPHYVDVRSINPLFGYLFAAHYGVFMLLGILLLGNSIRKRIGDKKQQKWMIVSYLVFIVPSLGLTYMRILSDSSIISVMCGFALITAVIFVFIIIPRYYSKLGKTKKKNS